MGWLRTCGAVTYEVVGAARTTVLLNSAGAAGVTASRPLDASPLGNATPGEAEMGGTRATLVAVTDSTHSRARVTVRAVQLCNAAYGWV